jgi:hypothetical protein
VFFAEDERLLHNVTELLQLQVSLFAAKSVNGIHYMDMLQNLSVHVTSLYGIM